MYFIKPSLNDAYRFPISFLTVPFVGTRLPSTKTIHDIKAVRRIHGCLHQPARLPVWIDHAVAACGGLRFESVSVLYRIPRLVPSMWFFTEVAFTQWTQRTASLKQSQSKT